MYFSLKRLTLLCNFRGRFYYLELRLSSFRFSLALAEPFSLSNNLSSINFYLISYLYIFYLALGFSSFYLSSAWLSMWCWLTIFPALALRLVCALFLFFTPSYLFTGNY
jgi:hypothetical protein